MSIIDQNGLGMGGERGNSVDGYCCLRFTQGRIYLDLLRDCQLLKGDISL